MPRKKKNTYRAYGWKDDDETKPGAAPLPTMSSAPIPDNAALTTTQIKLPAEFVEIEVLPSADGEEITIVEKPKKKRHRGKRRRRAAEWQAHDENRKFRRLLTTVNNVSILLAIFCLVGSCGETKMFVVGIALLILSWRIEKFLNGETTDG